MVVLDVSSEWDCQNKPKVGLKDNQKPHTWGGHHRQNKPKVGLKAYIYTFR